MSCIISLKVYEAMPRAETKAYKKFIKTNIKNHLKTVTFENKVSLNRLGNYEQKETKILCGLGWS